ncbi:MAG TPA: hypothetical protein VHL54_14160 [Actinomycetota bacterium]|nr:hypothetical protein [Actinomycetota bacterium]
MSDEEVEGQQAEEPASGDSAAVQAALAGIPGLADSLNRPAPAATEESEESEEGEQEQPEPGYGAPRSQVEDSETVQRALRQLGLQ